MTTADYVLLVLFVVLIILTPFVWDCWKRDFKYKDDNNG